MQEDLFFVAEVSYSKVNKVRGHLLSQYAILEIGLLIALITSTLLSETFSSCLGENLKNYTSFSKENQFDASWPHRGMFSISCSYIFLA